MDFAQFGGRIHRRTYLQFMTAAALLPIASGQELGRESAPAEVWQCPMEPEVRAPEAGKCPRCGMTLVLHVPDRIEFPLELTYSPPVLRPGTTATFDLRVINPVKGQPETSFQIVHDKLMHLFVVSDNLEFFAHVHPEPLANGLFRLPIQLPHGGMYRVLADFYPTGSVPQLAAKTVFVSGPPPNKHIVPAVAPVKCDNLAASLKLEPEQPLAGLESKLFYHLDPGVGLEPYLGAWAHMLIVSEDLIDLMHLHPFLGGGTPTIQFNVLFPRPGLYRVWAQFQREGVVNTTRFTLPVKEL